VEELTMDLIEVSAERDMLEQQLGVLRQELHALRAGQAQALQQAPIS
jgi:prefoldin subunit 5